MKNGRSVIEAAEARLHEAETQNRLGFDNDNDLLYWAAYLDGARAQKRETIEAYHEAMLDGRRNMNERCV